MWIAKHSAAWYPVFIEIERSVARGVFKGDRTELDPEFVHRARNQLTQWRAWMAGDDANQAVLKATFSIPDSFSIPD